MRAFYGEAFRARLGQQTLKDIAGLDAARVGFARPECCGATPKGLAKSTAMGQHFYFSTSVPPAEWTARSENIPGLKVFQTAVAKDFLRAGFTAFYDPCSTPDTKHARLLRFEPASSTDPQSDGAFAEYRCELPPAEVSTLAQPPWYDGEGGASRLSAMGEEAFVFVCAHLARDARCGYCGPILADLLEQAVAEQHTTHSADTTPSRVHIHRCTHVGGHIYAGNVLVYSKHGAVTYGLVNPGDVDVLARFLVAGTHDIPASLRDRVRGKAGRYV